MGISTISVTIPKVTTGFSMFPEFGLPEHAVTAMKIKALSLDAGEMAAYAEAKRYSKGAKEGKSLPRPLYLHIPTPTLGHITAQSTGSRSQPQPTDFRYIVTQYSMEYVERYQLVTTFGSSYLYLFGSDPRVLNISGHVVLDYNYTYVNQFESEWENNLKASSGKQIVIEMNGVKFVGRGLRMSINTTSITDNLLAVTMSVVVESVIDNVTYPKDNAPDSLTKLLDYGGSLNDYYEALGRTTKLVAPTLTQYIAGAFGTVNNWVAGVHKASLVLNREYDALISGRLVEMPRGYAQVAYGRKAAKDSRYSPLGSDTLINGLAKEFDPITHGWEMVPKTPTATDFALGTIVGAYLRASAQRAQLASLTTDRLTVALSGATFAAGRLGHRDGSLITSIKNCVAASMKAYTLGITMASRAMAVVSPYIGRRLLGFDGAFSVNKSTDYNHSEGAARTLLGAKPGMAATVRRLDALIEPTVATYAGMPKERFVESVRYRALSAEPTYKLPPGAVFSQPE